MKVVAYSVKPGEKGCFAKANTRKHDITLISNALSIETVRYAEGKKAVIVFTSDEVSEKVINILAGYGIKYIITRSVSSSHINKEAAKKHGIQLSNVPHYGSHSIDETCSYYAFLSPENLQLVANKTIGHIDRWQEGECKM